MSYFTTQPRVGRDVMIHLHRPVSPAPVCGAPVPADRARHLTAYRSEITCPACAATLRKA
jgi:hypothetical protein